jgi:hypothetical protein
LHVIPICLAGPATISGAAALLAREKTGGKQHAATRFACFPNKIFQARISFYSLSQVAIFIRVPDGLSVIYRCREPDASSNADGGPSIDDPINIGPDPGFAHAESP